MQITLSGEEFDEIVGKYERELQVKEKELSVVRSMLWKLSSVVSSDAKVRIRVIQSLREIAEDELK